jgi:hypothetical protein
MTLKKFSLPLIVLVFCACSTKKDRDPVLEQRLAVFLKAIDDKNPEKMTDYVYPKLFRFVSRDAILKTMNFSFFEDKDQKVGFDSVKIEKIFPIFKMDSASYAKINFSMVMTLEYSDLKDSLVNKKIPKDIDSLHHSIGIGSYPAPQLTLMQTLLAQEYGTENVTADPTTGIIKIHSKGTIIAVKDKFAGEWYFVTGIDESSIAQQLFSQATLDKLATYK